MPARSAISASWTSATGAARIAFSAASMICARRTAPRDIAPMLGDEPAPDRLRDGGGAVGDLELLEHVLQMRLDRRGAEVHLVRDLGVGAPVGRAPDDLRLAR